jgi:N-acyl homoserine lactone hydrolase
VAPESIRYLVQTHLHIDHTGALGHFPGATILVDAAELDAARALTTPYAHGYIRADFAHADLDWRVLTGEHDVFGDGTIRLLQTPGHSAGHRSILLELEDTGPVLLTADAVDNHEQWQGRRAPRALSSREQALASLQALRELAGATGALTIFGHDPENWSGLRHAPEQYC